MFPGNEAEKWRSKIVYVPAPAPGFKTIIPAISLDPVKNENVPAAPRVELTSVIEGTVPLLITPLTDTLLELSLSTNVDAVLLVEYPREAKLELPSVTTALDAVKLGRVIA